MNRHQLLFIIGLVFSCVITNAQTDTSDEFVIPSQTFMRFNRNLVNPTLSIFNSYKSEYVAYHRNQWFDYDESPKTYMVSYAGNNYENSGYGLSLYQQEVGVWKSFGGIANYAKGVRLNDETILSLGFNVVFFNSGLNRGKIITGEADPYLEQYDNTSVLMLNPGLSIQIGKLNFGVYGDNLVDYNFKSSEMQTKFGEKTISSHLSYMYSLENASNLFENSSLTFLARGKYIAMEDLEYSAGLLYNVPRAGWAQASYSDYYGVSGGLGINISQKIAIGYNYEKGLGKEITNLGATHELFLALTLDSNEEFTAYSKKPKVDKQAEAERLKNQTLEQEEIDRFKQNIYNQTIVETNSTTVKKLEEFVLNAENDNINYLLLPEKNTGIKKGYYVIATIYKEKNKATKYISDLKKKGLTKSGSFKTSGNQWNYVYIERFDSYDAAKKAYQTKFNNKYPETMWILPIL
ncbi:PorP/SprF family type IX secretion system membrane protein [Flavobacterium ponti]|uniref:PorP/SprF family type IX secretion system membrane protein n=1 Tax=Flavobacterium ponti TaxID=665133 RepID=A0ABV9P159_9FLAO